MNPENQIPENQLRVAFLSFVLIILLPVITKAQSALFFNEGALFHANPGSFMIVKNASLQNDYGNFDNGGTVEVEGHFINNAAVSGAGATGIFDIHGNWENNQTFVADQSTVNLIGDAQLLTGTQTSVFYNLALLGTGIKTQTIDQQVTNELRLNDRELATEANSMLVTNTDSGAITRSTGFVSSLGAGSLARHTNSINSYLFPVGSSLGIPRYRPVRMAPNNGTPNTYSVRLANTEATNEGFDLSVKEDSICFLNPDFYHRINRTSGTAPVDISVYYNIAADGFYNRIAHWQNDPEWQSTGTAGNINNSGAMLSKITKPAWSDFSYTPFALAGMNPTVEILGDNGFCKSSTVLLSTNTTSTGTLNYEWSKDGALAPGNANDSLYNAFQVGAYTVEVTDSNGCSAVSEHKNIAVFQLPSVVVTGNGVVCDGDTAAWFADATPGDGAIVQYLWKRNGFPVGLNSPFYTPSQDGNYSVEVTDINGCTIEETKRLLEIPAPQVIISGDDILCDSTTLTALASAGPGASITAYLWMLNGLSLPAGNNPTYVASESGDYTVEVTSSNGCTTESPNKAITDTCANDSCLTQIIPINEGWNMISGYIDPDPRDILAILNPIVSDIIILKNAQGQAAIPSLGINVIGDWIVEEGYKVKSVSSTELTLGCTQVDPPTTPIYLPPGWSIISYLRTSPMSAVTALNGITANTLIVKNVNGNSYIPSFTINTIGDMLPGQGYSIKMLNADTLYYPANQKTSASGYYQSTKQPARYIMDKNTGHNATIIIPEDAIENMQNGNEIGVFHRDGSLAGSGVYENRPLAITVWGDDPTTEYMDGMETGNEFVYKIWNPANQIEIITTVEYLSGETTYRDGGVSVLKKMKTDYAANFNLAIYPNPTYDNVHLQFNQPGEERISITVFDIQGKEILKNETKAAPGQNTVTLNLSQFSSGVYLIEFRSNSINRISKIEKFEN